MAEREKTNIILIGFMGSGKSSVGEKLARRLGYQFVDTDLEVETSTRKSIKHIFEQEGEERFRQAESKVIAEISERESQVISCGGGAVLNPANMEELRRKGKIIYLKGDPAPLFERIKESDERPLLNVKSRWEEFQRIFAERKERYEESADVIVLLDSRTQAEIVEEIVRRMGEE